MYLFSWVLRVNEKPSFPWRTNAHQIISAYKAQAAQGEAVSALTVQVLLFEAPVGNSNYCHLFLRWNSFQSLQSSSCLAVQIHRENHIVTMLTSCLQLEMKQKSLMGRGNDAEEKQNTEASEVNPETLGECCLACLSISGGLGKHYLVNLKTLFLLWKVT